MIPYRLDVPFSDYRSEDDLVLDELVRWFDRTTSGEATAPQTVSLARAVVAAGRVLVIRDGYGPDSPVARTLAAGEAYLRHPHEDTYRRYQEAATLSYPFGPGDGCFSHEPGGSCEAGTGCRSGAGTLRAVAAVIGSEAVLAAVKPALAG